LVKKLEIRLQPLRISTGWQIKWNTFYEIDPKEGLESFFGGSSLLQLQNTHLKKYIDVEWRPEFNINGEYFVTVLNYIENYNPKTFEYDIHPDWDKPYMVFSTKLRLELVAKLEHLMFELPIYYDPRILQKRGLVSEPSESFRLQLQEKGITEDIISKIINKGNSKIQVLLMDHKDINKEILERLLEKARSKKVMNKAIQNLSSRKFKK